LNPYVIHRGLPGSDGLPGYEGLPRYEGLPGYDGLPGYEGLPGYDGLPGYESSALLPYVYSDIPLTFQHLEHGSGAPLGPLLNVAESIHSPDQASLFHGENGRIVSAINSMSFEDTQSLMPLHSPMYDQEMWPRQDLASSDLGLLAYESMERSKKSRPSSRTHPFYKIKANKDGLYYCPFAEIDNCEHKAEKLKCYYE
jgi:hypothetical protein